MQIDDLICPLRLGCEEKSETEELEARNEFKRDFDRLIFLPAFRRLQGKTQVFPFPESDSTHNRLTHSLEVYSIARSLGRLIGSSLNAKNPDDIGDIVGAAGLAHDIGNSPFGHVGEVAFTHFFNGEEGRQIIAAFSEQEKADFQKYEGNATGFRSLTNTKPYLSQNKGGVGLTYSTLATFIKYPTRSNLSGNKQKASEKKHSFFAADESTVEKIFDRLGIPKKSPGMWPRHPFSFLIEAADDISYLIIDFEDGYRNRLIEYDTIYEQFTMIIEAYDGKVLEKVDAITDKQNKIGFLRSKAINSLIHQAADVFIANKDEILNFAYDSPLLDSIESKHTTDHIRSIADNELYNTRSVAEIEVAGFEVITGLLDIFITSFLGNGKSGISKKVKRLIPDEYYYGSCGSKDDIYNGYHLILNISEYICGMTDSFAIDLFRKLKGIEIPNY
jgi:dGTPase